MAIIGYARVSTRDQNLDLQLDALRAEGCSIVYEEKASGKTTKGRSELEHCIKALRPGDVLAVWRLDRLGRNLVELVQLIAELKAKEVGFKSLTECIDNTGPTGELVTNIFIALAQFVHRRCSQRRCIDILYRIRSVLLHVVTVSKVFLALERHQI